MKDTHNVDEGSSNFIYMKYGCKNVRESSKQWMHMETFGPFGKHKTDKIAWC